MRGKKELGEGAESKANVQISLVRVGGDPLAWDLKT